MVVGVRTNSNQQEHVSNCHQLWLDARQISRLVSGRPGMNSRPPGSNHPKQSDRRNAHRLTDWRSRIAGAAATVTATQHHGIGVAPIRARSARTKGIRSSSAGEVRAARPDASNILLHLSESSGGAIAGRNRHTKRLSTAAHAISSRISRSAAFGATSERKQIRRPPRHAGNLLVL